MAYIKHTWNSNELVTADKLNNIEIGLNDAASLADNNASDKLDKDFSSENYTSASTPFTGNEKIPIQQSGHNVYTDFVTLYNYFGNGQQMAQAALVNYKTTTADFNSLPQTIIDANITNQMVMLECVLSNSMAQTDDWQITTNDGSYTINGSINGTTNATITFGVASASTTDARAYIGTGLPDGYFTTADGKTVVVTDGFIVDIRAS